ncbi:MAG: DUF2807 domain-containing protein [Gammaproteobacteria bacterium]|nr:DUF2807 domain-containing protein [Gammaproteobacteria bacterium]
MIIRLKLICAIIFCTLVVNGCSATQEIKSSNSTTTHKQLRSFSKLKVQSSGKIYIKQGLKSTLTVKGSSNVINSLKTQVSGGELKIHCMNNCSNSESLSFFIETPSIKQISLENGGELSISTGFNREEHISIYLYNGGVVDAKALVVNSAKLTIRNGGDIKVNVSKKLEAEIKNGGNIYYIGDPEIISKKQNGGNIKRIKAKRESTTMKDPRDGKIYKIVQIGGKVWFAENLAYLPRLCNTNDIECGVWVYGQDGNDVSIAKQSNEYQKYGALYSWEKAKSACPTGWHLPNDEEWKVLEVELGIAASEIENGIWRGENAGDIARLGGSSGLNVTYGGWRTGFGKFNYIEEHANFWVDTEFDETHAYERLFGANNRKVGRHTGIKSCGFSVRCVKDQED